MSFASQITRSPLAYEPDNAAETLARLPWVAPPLRALLLGAAGCSPYLAGLMIKQAGWLEDALAGAPEAALAAVLTDLVPGPQKEVAVSLRLAKQKVALLVALADLGGVWGLDDVTGALTRFADRALDVALKSALLPDLTRGKLPGQSEADLGEAAGLVALAMGKMGAHELNYSSDIDIICLFDNDRFDPDDIGEARSVYVRAVRRAMGLLSDLTGDGYVFRTDLRLRPDPSATPVAMPVAAAERYYEALGRTWERAAFVKARPAAGALSVGRRFLKDIRPFIWRRHLDFTTIQDAQDIREKIRRHKGQAGIEGLDGRNVKLGPGGIREIEFFTQTRQLIAGGRDPELRVRETRRGLQRLSEKGWVPGADARELDRDYQRLREIEHRGQMIQDAQTHSLPGNDEGWQRLAMFTGGGDVAALKAELREIFEQVHRLTEDFFAPARPVATRVAMSDTTQHLVERWRQYPALRSSRAQEIFGRLLPQLLHGFERAASPDEAIAQFDGFLKGLPAGVQLFSLFEANPQLIELMVDISSTSPALARYLSSQSGVLDAVIGGTFFEAWPGLEALQADLTRHLTTGDLDYEGQLDAARHWMKDWRFRIGVHHLRGLIGPSQASAEYSDLAQATVSGIWDITVPEFVAKHGSLPGRGAVVLGMGSLGARRLSARSDLDLIVIYDAPPDAESTGPRPLAAGTYYARLTKALVTGLSAQTAGGMLYEVDMRLRPSGRRGPAAASWTGFQSYQRTEAWTWEHLALTRARVVAGEPSLARDLEAFRREIVTQPRDPVKVWRDLAEMRVRLAAAKPRRAVWDISNGPGGLQDIELFAQALALLAGSRHRRVGNQLAAAGPQISESGCAALKAAHDLLSEVKSAARLLTDQPLDPSLLGHGGRKLLLRDSRQTSIPKLAEMLETRTAEAAAIIEAAIAQGGGSEEDDDLLSENR